MKKLLVIIVLIGTMQNKLFSQSIGKGKSVFYIGAGLGTGNFGAGKYRGTGFTYFSTPTFHLGFEHGITEEIPKSIIGLGGALSFSSGRASYKDAYGYGWNSGWSDLRLLVKGYYHHEFLVGEKWDVYAAALLGFKYRFYSFTTNDPYYNSWNRNEAGVYPAGGVAVGGRYYFSKSMGFYAEVGQGVNVDYLQGGFAFKF